MSHIYLTRNLMETPLLPLHTQFYNYIQRSPIIHAATYSHGPQLHFKDETVQESGLFKDRGALNCMLHMYDSQRKRMEEAGVVAASAGNHGQGVARAGKYLGVSVTLFVPSTTPQSKVEAMLQYGASVKTVAGDVDDALKTAQIYCSDTSALFVHPFEDEAVITGQSTVGREIYNEKVHTSFDKVFVPVGGGGLLAGVCLGLASKGYLGEVYGVQLEGADAFARSMHACNATELEYTNPLSDGTAVRRAGELALNHVRASENYVDTIVVTEAELGDAIVLQDQLTGIYGEPAGCLAFAGMKRLVDSHHHGNTQNWLGIISGKHRDPLRYKALISAAQNACG